MRSDIRGQNIYSVSRREANFLTYASLLGRGSLEACVAPAVIGTRCVDTVSVRAWVWCAFINICWQQREH